MSLFQLKLRVLQQRGRDLRVVGMGSAELDKKRQSSLPPPSAQFDPGQIPLGKGAPRLFWFMRPAFQFGAGRFALGAVKFIELRENPRKIGIGRMMFNEVFDKIVARLRRS